MAIHANPSGFRPACPTPIGAGVDDSKQIMAQVVLGGKTHDWFGVELVKALKTRPTLPYLLCVYLLREMTNKWGG